MLLSKHNYKARSRVHNFVVLLRTISFSDTNNTFFFGFGAAGPDAPLSLQPLDLLKAFLRTQACEAGVRFSE